MTGSCDALLVLSLRQCRFLPAPAGFSVRAEASFGGQLLHTEPLPLTSHVDLNTELVWQTDRRCLQWHRQQRTCIKVKLLAARGCDAPASFHQMMGYIVVSVRDSQENAQPQWRKLLGCRKNAPLEDPAVKVSLSVVSCKQQDSLDDCKISVMSSPVRCQSPPAVDDSHKISTSPVAPVLSNRISPFAVRKSGDVFQIGDVEVDQQMFLFSITILAVKNSELVIPASLKRLCMVDSRISFFMNFLSSDIESDSFSSSQIADLPPQTFDFRILSTWQSLQLYFQQLNSLDIHICLGGLSVGFASVPLSSLFPISNRPDTDARTVEDEFIINQSAESSYTAAQSARLCVSVSVAALCENSADHVPTDQQQHHCPSTARSGDTDIGDHERPPEANCANAQTVSLHLSSASVGVDNHCRHYRFVLDLQNVLFAGDCFARRSVLLRFSYPYFGSVCDRCVGPLQVESRPVSLNLDVTYEYNFAAPYSWLKLTLQRFPLVVHVLDVNIGESLGTIRLDLSGIIGDDLQATGVCERFNNTCCVSADILSPKNAVLGRLEAFLSLEDMGKSDVIWSVNDGQSTEQIQTPLQPISLQLSTNAADELQKEDHQPSELPLSSGSGWAQRELQDWMEQQQRQFTERLRQKEAAHLRALNDEWKRCDSSRELQFQQRLRGVNELHGKLSTGLNELDERRRQLDAEMERLNGARLQMRLACDRLSVQSEKLRLKVQTHTDQCVRRAQSSIQHLSDQMVLVKRYIAANQSARSDRVAELTRQLDSAVKAKLYYKYRWAETACQLEELKHADSGQTHAEKRGFERHSAASNRESCNQNLIANGRRVLSQLQDASESSPNIIPDIDKVICVDSDGIDKLGESTCHNTNDAGDENNNVDRTPGGQMNQSAQWDGGSAAVVSNGRSTPCSPLSHSSGYHTSVSSLNRAVELLPGNTRSTALYKTASPEKNEHSSGRDRRTTHGRHSREKRIAQLGEERRALLETGLYSEDDHVIKLLESVIERLSNS